MATRRGRPRREDQFQDRLRHVTTLFRQGHSTLDQSPLFDGCPGVRQLVAAVGQRVPRAIYQQGTAVDMLIRGAALDVMGELYAAERQHEERLAQFIQAYFFEERTIVDITSTVLGLSDRTYVSRSYRLAACDLVARRVLALADHDDPLAVSAGLREVLEQQAQRWDRAAKRAGAVLQHERVRHGGAHGPIPPAALPTASAPPG